MPKGTQAALRTPCVHDGGPDVLLSSAMRAGGRDVTVPAQGVAVASFDNRPRINRPYLMLGL